MADTATTSTLRSGNDLTENNMTAVSTTLNQAAASVLSGSDVRDSGPLGFYHPYSTTTLTDNYTTTTTTTTSHERRVPAATTTLVDAAAAELVPSPSLHTKPTVATTAAAPDANLSLEVPTSRWSRVTGRLTRDTPPTLRCNVQMSSDPNLSDVETADEVALNNSDERVISSESPEKSENASLNYNVPQYLAHAANNGPRTQAFTRIGQTEQGHSPSVSQPLTSGIYQYIYSPSLATDVNRKSTTSVQGQTDSLFQPLREMHVDDEVTFIMRNPQTRGNSPPNLCPSRNSQISHRSRRSERSMQNQGPDVVADLANRIMDEERRREDQALAREQQLQEQALAREQQFQVQALAREQQALDRATSRYERP